MSRPWPPSSAGSRPRRRSHRPEARPVPPRIDVTLEETPKRTFATAIDWPGWSRGGKTAELALETLASYARRYQPIVGRVDPRLSDDVSVADFHVVERVAGGAGTEFGVPSGVTDADRRPTDAREAGRRADIVEAAWGFLERTAAEAPEELRKGPRGGGRNASKVLAHVLDADRAYANEMGIKVGSLAVEERAAIR